MSESENTVSQGQTAEPGSEETREETLTVSSTINLPEYTPLDLPYSQWGAQRSQELLSANGFGDTAAEWRRAARHENGLIREAALYLLVRRLDPADEDLFRRALADGDETVQALAAYGLVRLGDDEALSTLQRLAHLDPDSALAAPLAASLLAELGDPAAFDTMTQALANEFGYVRLIAMQYLASFEPLQGQEAASGRKVDVWSLYCQALGDEDGQVSAVAELQLAELDSPEARRVLNECAP